MRGKRLVIVGSRGGAGSCMETMRMSSIDKDFIAGNSGEYYGLLIATFRHFELLMLDTKVTNSSGQIIPCTSHQLR